MRYGSMLLTASHVLPVGEYDFALKWDGFRAAIDISDGRVTIWSRQRHDMTRRFPELAELATHVKGDAWLDGEIVVLRPDGRPSFHDLASNWPRGRKTAATFIAFDALERRGRKLVDEPRETRRAVLEELIPSDTPGLMRSREFADGAALYEQASTFEIEGIVAYRRGSLYTPGRRSRDWIKVLTPAGRAEQARRSETFMRRA